MPNVLAVFIGQSMRKNFDIALGSGTWGCPVPQEAPITAGDTVLFVGGVPGGPRQTGDRPLGPTGEPMTSHTAWLTRTASLCWTATISSGWFEDESEIWEAAPDRYRFRFNFSDAIDRGSISLQPGLNLTREASLAIKLAGVQVKNGGLQCQAFPDGALLLDGHAPALSAEDTSVETWRFKGDLNVQASRHARAEQAELRKRLLSHHHRCALCGRLLPPEFLVAAHIKKRSLCTDSERRDLDNIAMLACSFGCDIGYELGVLVVNGYGKVELNPVSPHDSLGSHFAHVVGKDCGAFRSETATYFSWHREHHS